MTDMIIGIDLGTTNTLAAMVFEDGPEVIGSDDDICMIPSLLSFQDSGWLVGDSARPFLVESPLNTVFSVKRLIGRGFDEIEKEIKKLPYRVESAQRKLVKVIIEGEFYTPQELSAVILTRLKEKVEKILGHSIEKAVITVPAYFDDTQRQATRDAAQIAGLEIIRIINEPTAAAIAYGLDEKKQGHVAIYDLGGGTFDISILELKGKLFKVVASHGDTQLGGDDIDRKLVEVLKNRVKADYPQEVCENPQDQQILRMAAEKIKISLSTTNESKYSFDLFESSIHIEGVFTLEELNHEIQPLLERTFQSCKKALSISGLNEQDIDEVVLVGGTTQIPAVRRGVELFFGRSPHLSIDPYKVVALGASIHGHLLVGGRRDFILLDVIPLALGIETLGGTFSKVIMGNSSLPAEETEVFTTNVDNQTTIEINIYQGERELVKDCRCLGQFNLRGIPPMKAGFPLVEVSFHVDSNGLLTVSAYEKRSETTANIEVIPSHGLTQQEIDAIMEESFENAVEDFNHRQLIEFRHTAERMFRGIEENRNLAEEIFSVQELNILQKQMKVVRLRMEENDSKLLKSEIDKLGDLTRPLADSSMGKAILKELQEN